MFDFFKKDNQNNKLDVKELREIIIQFIKEQLQQLDGGEGGNIIALQLYVNPQQEERFLYDAALYIASPEKFQDEVQRIADNFAIDLPAGWKLEVNYVPEIPAGVIISKEAKAGLSIKIASAVTVVETSASGLIRVLNGTAEQEEYMLEPGTKRINIGREKNVQIADGSFRLNAIAFPADAHESNKFISRQHAHIEWDEKSAAFLVYADEGGVPPANKTKIRSSKDNSIHKLNSSQVGYLLKSGDQVILGESAVLEFI